MVEVTTTVPTIEANGNGTAGATKDEKKKVYHAMFLARILRSSQFTAGLDKNKCHITPVVLELRKYQPAYSEERNCSVDEIPDWEMLHSLVGLYDSYLPEVTPEVLYNNLTAQNALTIVFLRDVDEIVKERKDEKPKEVKEEPVKEAKPAAEEDEEEEEEEERLFEDVFSDEDSEDEGEESDGEESDDDEHYNAGLSEFLEQVKQRKKLRAKDPQSFKSVGVESQLVAAATFKMVKKGDDTARKEKEKVIQLTLLAVRKRFRKIGIGRQLLNFTRNPIVVGEYDAIVSYVDPGATNFFLRNGFSNDLILNNRFSDLVDPWDNSTMMSYLPPYSECLSSGTLLKEMSTSLGDEVRKWRRTSVEAYQTQLSCLERMRHEIMLLRTTVSTQETTINSLTSEIDRLRLSKGVCEREFREYRSQVRGMLSKLKSGQKNLETTEAELMTLTMGGADIANGHTAIDGVEQVGELEFINAEDEIRATICSVPSYSSIRITKIEKQSKAEHSLQKNLFKARCNALRDPALVTKLYYCGGKGGTLHRVLKDGFTPKDMVPGDYGIGLYFTQNPIRAMQYSEPGLLLQCDVGIGVSESVLKMDYGRNRPPVGYDSVLTGERDVDHIGIYSHQRHKDLLYLIFDAKQALPLYLIHYTV